MVLDADLIFAGCSMLGIAASLFVGGRWLGRRAGKAVGPLVVLGLLAATAFSWFASEHLFWATLIPLSGVLLWSHWTPLLVAAAAGLTDVNPSLPARRRRRLSCSLIMVAGLLFLHPLLRGVVRPIVGWETARWQGEDCIQSHSATCGPASAATLLRHVQIDASERQLAAWCLSSQDGTSSLGLYRGLLRATADTDLQPQPTATSLRELVERRQLPAVALVEFQTAPQSLLTTGLFGRSDSRHAVVLLGRDARGNWRVSDPAVGRVVWDNDTLESRFTGQALHLKSRSHSPNRAMAGGVE